ncbi:Crp/Fnr family transcriptional regulator [Ruegeria sp. B32]|uniref:Crp/Fnr family transcriptional regulator n=1 Tax=Ruegeria sp. B32 TaxID=2867020 RepID=UPI0021A46615|nr:Crp/Fnr family transcriptional regulator [Ruegeria sp. B32]UWR07627.1 Crp/Fnr family transcriptional regulator [Ruegeria sp. B32]
MTQQRKISLIACADCPLRQMDVFLPFSGDDLRFMQDFKTGEMQAEPGTQLFIEGAKSAHLFTVLSGMGVRYKTLENGRRQVIGFVLPGDLVGLQAGVMGEMRHSVEATTAMRLCVFNRSRLFELYQNQPDRAFDLTFLAAVEEHFLGDALTTVGQRGAIEKIAWSLHRFYTRSQAVGLAKGLRCPLPYRQQDLADALGLSLVHTNKTLRRLKDLGLAEWSNNVLQINDLEGLAELGLVEITEPVPRPLI